MQRQSGSLGWGPTQPWQWESPWDLSAQLVFITEFKCSLPSSCVGWSSTHRSQWEIYLQVWRAQRQTSEKLFNLENNLKPSPCRCEIATWDMCSYFTDSCPSTMSLYSSKNLICLLMCWMRGLDPSSSQKKGGKDGSQSTSQIKWQEGLRLCPWKLSSLSDRVSGPPQIDSIPVLQFCSPAVFFIPSLTSSLRFLGICATLLVTDMLYDSHNNSIMIRTRYPTQTWNLTVCTRNMNSSMHNIC